MNQSEKMNHDERYVYRERLALLGLEDREPDEREHQMAMEDVKQYRRRVSELMAALA